MSWLLGAGMGFLRGGPMGAVVGGALQHFLSKKIEKSLKKGLPALADQALFVTSLAVALTKMAMLGGPVTLEQVRIIHRFFVKNLNYGPADLRVIDDIILETQKVNPGLEPVIEQYLKASGHNYASMLLALSYQIVLTVRVPDEETQKRINALSHLLKVSYEDHNRIRKKYSLFPLRTPYTILGIESSASDEEVRKAYRQRVSQYHPDRVAHLGDEPMEEAHLKFLEILDAYQELERVRGL